MTKEYVFFVYLDGPMCGMSCGSIELSPNPSVDAWSGVLDEMAYDHVSSYMDIDEYEEEQGCELELDSRAEAWDPEEHHPQVNGVDTYESLLENMKQDEEGRWYVEK